LHAVALDVWTSLLAEQRQSLLTDWIAAETANGMARTNARVQAADFLLGLCDSAYCELCFVGEGLLDESIVFYRDRPDKTWGLVDCCSMLVMHKRGVSDVFTNDKHFEQASFRCLLSK
jgi:predicted nucleic acid-binding protein